MKTKLSLSLIVICFLFPIASHAAIFFDPPLTAALLLSDSQTANPTVLSQTFSTSYIVDSQSPLAGPLSLSNINFWGRLGSLYILESLFSGQSNLLLGEGHLLSDLLILDQLFR